MNLEAPKVKICRNCHSLYKSLKQKFCGNGCEFKDPYYINGKKNEMIVPREVVMKNFHPLIIRWVCNCCKREYSSKQIEKMNFLCDCGVENDFYPFTEKECQNEDCKEQSGYHELALEAKACDLCGDNNFRFNDLIPKTSLKPSSEKSETCWNGPLEHTFSTPIIQKEKNKNLPSCTLTFLNNNLQYILYGESKELSIFNLIKDSRGFVPDEIYESLLTTFPENTDIFRIHYNPETEQFSFSCEFEGVTSELDARFSQKNTISFKKKEKVLLKENILTQIRAGFFKIHAWVY